MKTGILGGVFDPPHNGHVALARAAIEHFGLGRLLVLVAAAPGHKDVVLDAPTRLRLAEAAFGELPGAEISLDENAFTIDLVEGGGFRDSLFILGADELAAFPTWKEPERVLDEIRLAVGTRPGYPPELLDAVIARLGRPDRVELFELSDPLDIASTQVRQRVARDEPVEDLVPPSVAALIGELALYRQPGG